MNSLLADLVDPIVDQGYQSQHLIYYSRDEVPVDLLVDGTTIKVARECLKGFDDSFSAAVWIEAKLSASVSEPAMADNIVNDFPSPISSAIMPPLASRCSGTSDPVRMCRKLSRNQLHIYALKQKALLYHTRFHCAYAFRARM